MKQPERRRKLGISGNSSCSSVRVKLCTKEMSGTSPASAVEMRMNAERVVIEELNSGRNRDKIANALSLLTTLG